MSIATGVYIVLMVLSGTGWLNNAIGILTPGNSDQAKINNTHSLNFWGYCIIGLTAVWVVLILLGIA